MTLLLSLVANNIVTAAQNNQSSNNWVISNDHAVSIDGLEYDEKRGLVVQYSSSGSVFWSKETGEVESYHDYNDGYKNKKSISLHPKGYIYAEIDRGIKIIHRRSRELLAQFGSGSKYKGVWFAPGKKRLVAAIRSDGGIELWNYTKESLLHHFKGNNATELIISNNGKLLASLEQYGGVIIYDLGKMDILQKIEDKVRHAAFSKDASELFLAQDDGISRWSIKAGKKITSYGSLGKLVTRVLPLSDDNLVLGGTQNGQIIWWDINKPQPIAIRLNFDHRGKPTMIGDAWAISTISGHYDTKDFDLLKKLASWKNRKKGKRKEVSKEDFIPGLHTDVYGRNVKFTSLNVDIGGNHSRADRKNDGRSSGLKLTSIKLSGNAEVAVIVTVFNHEGCKETDSDKDILQLFREDRLVATETLTDAYSDEKEIIFSGIGLPVVKTMGEVTFNTKLYSCNKQIGVSERLFKYVHEGKARTPRVYLIGIGVNESISREEDFLDYAENDARTFTQIMSEQIATKRNSGAQEIIKVNLVSKVEDRSKELLATKNNIRDLFFILAGKSPPLPSEDSPLLNFKKATPDDEVFIIFATHGIYLDEMEEFYLLPAKFGNPEIGSTHFIKRSISSDELSKWLSGIDGKETILILDACQSAAIVEGHTFKPGPFSQKGLGQLAFDSQWRVLAGSQSSEPTNEYSLVKHGILTYSLIYDALIAQDSDTDANNVISLTEWLNYAVERTEYMSSLLEMDVQSAHDGILSESMQTSGKVLQRPQLFNYSKSKGLLIQTR